MHGTTSSIRAAGGISGAGHQPEIEPVWRPWLRLLELVLAAADDASWAAAVPEPAADRPPDAPLLHGVLIRLDARRFRRLVRELVRHASAGEEAGGASLARLRSRRLDMPGLLRAAIARDGDAIERVATAAGAEPNAVDVVAQLASVPLLQACAKRLGGRVPPDWMKGYCPICGAWPTLAELRGLERNRRLRCGRCSSDWPLPVLRCPFCDELHHKSLGSLLPEGEAQTRRVDVCNTCKGYLKTFTTIRPMSLRSLLMDDLASVELDLAAQERGYTRPARTAYPLAIAVERVSRLPAVLERWT
jgi:FdhE protein